MENELCGPPLVEGCKIDEKASDSGNGGPKEDVEDEDWFYMGIGKRFTVGFFLGVIGPIMFPKPWRCFYLCFVGYMWHKIVCN